VPSSHNRIGYTKNDMPRRTLDLYDELKRKGLFRCDDFSLLSTSTDPSRSDLVFYLLLINAAGRLMDESRCESVAKEVPSSFLASSQILNALVDMWVSQSSRAIAKFILVSFRSSRVRSVVSTEPKQSTIRSTKMNR
jgi:hypothetical protein